MLFVLSPAKSLDYETPVPEWAEAAATRPAFVPRSAELITLLKRKSPAEIGTLMDLSQALSELNVDRYAKWTTRFTPRNSKPAALAFDGDVYDGLQARRLGEADLHWAQRHVAILSGLYGVLKPLDRMQPYRLEMGTGLANEHGANLYAYWGDTIAEKLNTMQRGERDPVVVNLASQEYWKAAERRVLKARVIECVFEDWKDGRYKVISFFAKRARGSMARAAILGRWTRPEQLPLFAGDGYRHAVRASEPDRLVFRRRVAA